jgi:hypothetical protein
MAGEWDGEEEFAAESERPDPVEGVSTREGPPDDWSSPSWYDYRRAEWWFRFVEGAGHEWRRDPPPARPIGHVDGSYIFVTAAGELRRFTASALHNKGGLADLFGGDLRWPRRHYPGRDREGNPTDRPSIPHCMESLIGACVAAGYYDGAIPHRSVGTWRGVDGLPVVHAGDAVFAGGEILDPGSQVGEALYVVGGARQAPAHRLKGAGGFEWLPADVSAGHAIAALLDEWHWQDDEARDLFLGGLFCDLLGDAPTWKPHRFVRAPAGSGKSTLLKLQRAILGGSAHPVQRTYSKAYLEQHFAHTACALLLDESESDTEAERVRKLWDLVLLLSDDGASGGRGTSGGQARQIDLRGSVTMVATLTEAWKTTIRSRVAFLELRPLAQRADRPPSPPSAVAKQLERAAALSPGLRARAIVRFGLFQQNLAIARTRILELGGAPRDADQIGHLVAGWATMTSDQPLDAADVAELERFRPYILTVVDEEDGADDASELLNVLWGLPAPAWRGGDQLTIGQLVARARFDDAIEARRSLLAMGFRFHKLPAETWSQAWLAIANKHPALDRLLVDYPQFRGPKRSQILVGLRRVVDGQVVEAKASDAPMRFAGPQSRALLLPPAVLPSLADEEIATGRRDDRQAAE